MEKFTEVCYIVVLAGTSVGIPIDNYLVDTDPVTWSAFSDKGKKYRTKELAEIDAKTFISDPKRRIILEFKQISSIKRIKVK